MGSIVQNYEAVTGIFWELNILYTPLRPIFSVEIAVVREHSVYEYGSRQWVRVACVEYICLLRAPCYIFLFASPPPKTIFGDSLTCFAFAHENKAS